MTTTGARDSPKEMTPVNVRITHWPGLSVNPLSLLISFRMGRARVPLVQVFAAVVEDTDVLVVLVVVDEEDEELLLVVELELEVEVVALPDDCGTKTSSFPPWPLQPPLSLWPLPLLPL
jgi:hypothetical protein